MQKEYLTFKEKFQPPKHMAAVFYQKLFAPNKIVKRDIVIVGKLDRRPQRELPFSALITLIYRYLHIKILGNFLLSFIAILTKIAHPSICEHKNHFSVCSLYCSSALNTIISSTLQDNILHRSSKVTVLIGLSCFNRSRRLRLTPYWFISLYVLTPFCFKVL